MSMKDSEKLFPVIPEKGTQPHPTKIPWWVADIAYSAYVSQYGKCQSLERIAERGGFYASELDVYLPDWRHRCEVAFMRAERIEDLQRENSELRDYIRQLRQFDAAVDACDECVQQIPCAEHSARVIELSKIARELAP